MIENQSKVHTESAGKIPRGDTLNGVCIPSHSRRQNHGFEDMSGTRSIMYLLDPSELRIKEADLELCDSGLEPTIAMPSTIEAYKSIPKTKEMTGKKRSKG